MHSRDVLFFLLIPLALVIAWGAPANALLVRAGENVFVSENETLTQDLALFASEISVDGYVDSDVISFSRSIVVTGVINQDLQGAAETIDLTGQVGDDLRFGAKELDIRGPVGNDVICAGQLFTLWESGRVGGEVQVWCAKGTFYGDIDGNLRIGSETANLYGHVGGDLKMDGRSITLAGAVDGRADITADTIILTPECIINGDLSYTSINEAQIQEGAQVLGEIQWHKPAEEIAEGIAEKKILQGLGAFWVFLKVAMFVAQIIVGLILIAISRQRAVHMAATVFSHPWKSLGVGFVFMFCLPIAALILLFTLIGTPLALLAFSVYFIIWYLGPIVVGLGIGGKMTGALKEISTGRLVGGLLLGLFILRAISFVPILGGFVQFFVLLFGVGAVLVSWKTAREKTL
jgi:cytoskeletal protein CcmA (bactofilin family)